MNPSKTTIDWFRFRVQSEPRYILEALRPLFGEDEGKWLNLDFEVHGVLGFQQACVIRIGSMPIGRMDYGGESQRGWVRVDINGKGCEWVKHWESVKGLSELPNAQIRRLDVALTTWRGEVTHQMVVDAHAAGQFITAIRPPGLVQITSSDPRAGKTCYIGKRERSDKFLRCYEKGLEMVAKFDARGNITTHINGFLVEDIYRCEVEFKASNSDIPWEAIARRDSYFAGAYPFCAAILSGVESDILQRRPERAVQASLSVALENCKVQFGPTLFTALMAYHGDMTAVWDLIFGDHHSETLLEAGVLLVDHE